MTLADALAPLGTDRFLREFVGQQYALIKGPPGKFKSLFSWRELDDVLRAVRVNDDRVYLVKNTQRIARDSYVVYVRPELVVEIAFNEIQESPQYPGRLALRFARVKRYRADKSAAEADTFATIQEIYRQTTGLEPPPM